METKQWVNLEEELIGPQLRCLPWIKPHLRPKKKELTIFVNATLKIWDTIIKRGKLSTMASPMTPLFSNPEFQPALETTNYFKWNILENARVEQILVDGKLPKLQDLGPEYKSKWLQYYQLKTFIELKIPLINRPKTKFEKILVEEQEPTKKLSKIYNLLLPSGSLSESIGMKKWEKEIENPISEEEWEKIFEIIHKTSIANKYQERNYKIAMR